MSIKDIEYALMLLTIQDLNDSFDSFNVDELDNNNNDLIFLLILFTLSCSHENHVPKSQHWYHEILPLYDDILFQNKGNKPQAPVEFQLVIFLRCLGSKDDILSTVILKKLEFVQWPKNNNRAIIHAGFQAIGVSEYYWSNRWDHGTHFILNEAPAQDQTTFFTRIKKICNSLSRNC
ncbi:hypothetical protein RhiirA4_477278 [Rhizophagus irregularis]|uniref:Uncharacterized protein n=1 Tax=Rhizophagus irregularis TaxID=588596 RepID=A0A2I1HCZ9_9GLOM|nr:hypothetical protein RhiirA4_477278 [Rhizophagus irregularis]